MRALLRGMTIVGIFALLVSPTFAGGAQEVDFLAGFETALQGEGLSEEEAAEIAAAAQEYDWNSFRDADPEVVAEAVVQARADAELTPEEHAELAHALAENAERLDDEGYSRSEVAEATLQAVEELKAQIQAWHDGDQEEPLGQTIRNTVSTAAREAAQARERETESGGDGADLPDEAEEAGDPADAAPSGAGQAGAGAGNR